MPAAGVDVHAPGRDLPPRPRPGRPLPAAAVSRGRGRGLPAAGLRCSPMLARRSLLKAIRPFRTRDRVRRVVRTDPPCVVEITGGRRGARGVTAPGAGGTRWSPRLAQ